MADAKECLTRLESALTKYDQILEMLITLTTTDERQATLYDSLVEIEDHVGALEDRRLTTMYDRLVEGHRTFIPKYQQVLQTDYHAFFQRIVKLGTDLASEINDADIGLREAIGVDSSSGLWGPKGWQPNLTGS